jgi:hypothetical protein
MSMPIWAGLAVIALVLVLAEISNHWLGRLADKWWSSKRKESDRTRHP